MELADCEHYSRIFVRKLKMSGSPVQFELRHKRVFVAGHSGMVGSALIRRLALESCKIVTAKAKISPDAVFLAAGKVGGIHANSTYPADFIADNLAIALNV